MSDDCTCYLNHPDDPNADEEACAACDRAFWIDPVFALIVDGEYDAPPGGDARARRHDDGVRDSAVRRTAV